MAKTGAVTRKIEAPTTVLAYMQQELARDAELKEMVDEQMAEIRVQQDLAELREQHGLSQAQLAQLLGVSQPAVARFERGENANIGLKTIVRAAAALGATVTISIKPAMAPKPPMSEKVRQLRTGTR